MVPQTRFISHASYTKPLRFCNLQVILNGFDCERSQIFFSVSMVEDHGGENQRTFNRFCHNTLNENPTYLKVPFLKRKIFPKYWGHPEPFFHTFLYKTLGTVNLRNKKLII